MSKLIVDLIWEELEIEPDKMAGVRYTHNYIYRIARESNCIAIMKMNKRTGRLDDAMNIRVYDDVSLQRRFNPIQYDIADPAFPQNLLIEINKFIDA